MYTEGPLLQEAEEQQDKMMDCNYSKVNIDAMVTDLDIDDSNKEQLKKTLRKFENGLFGWGLGKLKNCKTAHIKLKPGASPYKGRYNNLPKAYEYTCKKEIQRMVDIGVLKELPWYDDSLWASPTFGIPKEQVIYVLLLILESWTNGSKYTRFLFQELMKHCRSYRNSSRQRLSIYHLGFIQFHLTK